MKQEEEKSIDEILDELRLIKTELRMRSLQEKESVCEQPPAIIDMTEIGKVINDAEKNNFSQLESLINIQNVLNIRFPLPKMRNWAISPDFAELLLREILIRKPENIVEFGSGVSTLITGYALQMNKQGKLTSFDHDVFYGKKTVQNLKLHGLEEFAEVISAPISDITINNRDAKWYSVDETKVPAKIDMLVVDGPPARTDKAARYPALPYLIDRLADDAIVIMDDGIRQEEREICRRWLEEYPEFESEYVETEKGAFILRRQTSHHA
ncbi:class I SAM-dependent methyltransferase [Sulfurimonas sp. HSL3-7]|uniref:class I SAM-dependent methyltransferase n=1 Tax=Sulfonitrofixus jiaomeiensis TaxID=3131938 RepID=UPI0031F9BEBD